MESIPVPIQEDILIRLPLKSLLACSYVYKKLKTIICNEDFKYRYLLLSMKRPMDPTPHSLFYNVCQNEIPFEKWKSSAPVQGVVCLQSSTRFLLCSPITNYFLRLPDIGGLGPFSRNCFLGCDEATGVFKVLLPRLYNKPLVYTVRSGGEGSWRPIACEHPHIVSFSCAMCKEGVLYYAAITRPALALIIMSFNVSSEAFEVFPLPEGVVFGHDSTMVNYNGKIALVINPKHYNGEFQLCVRNEVSGQWELQRLVIPGWRHNVGNYFLSFVGTIGTGELVFTTSALLVDGSETVLHYKTDPPEGSSGFKMHRIEADNGGSYHYVRACFNHFDSRFRTN